MLVLRLSGVIVGPLAVAVAVICFILAPGPRRLSDRFIVFFAIGFGWMMLLGWIPRLETRIDVPGILLAGVFGFAAANQFHNRRFRVSLREWPLATEAAAIAIGTAATLWWALPLLRLNPSGRLKALFPGWDNAAFFDMFRQILLHGSFSSIPKPLPGEGLPQTWALLVRLWNPHPPTATHWVLNAYDAVLLLTLGAIVTLGCMSVARVCRQEFWLALPAMAAVVEIFVVGRLWIFNGYPTFDLPIAAATAAVIFSWRKTLSPWPHFVAIAGLTLVAAYTWYPIILLGAPALIAAALRLMKASSRRSQGINVIAFACTGMAFLGPLLHFGNESHKASLSYAASAKYEIALFTPGTPWVLVVLSIAGLLLYVIIQGTPEQRLEPRAPGCSRCDRCRGVAFPGGFGALGFQPRLILRSQVCYRRLRNVPRRSHNRSCEFPREEQDSSTRTDSGDGTVSLPCKHRPPRNRWIRGALCKC